MLECHTKDVDIAMQRLLLSSPSTLEQMVYILNKLEASTEQLADVRRLLYLLATTLEIFIHHVECSTVLRHRLNDIDLAFRL